MALAFCSDSASHLLCSGDKGSLNQSALFQGLLIEGRRLEFYLLQEKPLVDPSGFKEWGSRDRRSRSDLRSLRQNNQIRCPAKHSAETIRGSCGLHTEMELKWAHRGVSLVATDIISSSVCSGFVTPLLTSRIFARSLWAWQASCVERDTRQRDESIMGDVFAPMFAYVWWSRQDPCALDVSCLWVGSGCTVTWGNEKTSRCCFRQA